MSRTFGQMSEIEQSQYRNWKAKIDNPLSTEAERKEARHALDALEWGGQTGPVMQKLTDLEERVNGLTESGEMTDDDRQSIKALRSAGGDLPQRLEDVNRAVMSLSKRMTDIETSVADARREQQDAYSKNQALATENARKIEELETSLSRLQGVCDEKFRSVEEGMTGVIADAIADARDSIQGEVTEVAQRVVSDLIHPVERVSQEPVVDDTDVDF